MENNVAANLPVGIVVNQRDATIRELRSLFALLPDGRNP
jgi:hypothetical protein